MIDVSVVIPTYNSEKILENRVREFVEVLRCTGWTWEILICDDGSSDRSAEIAERLSQEFPQCRVLASATNRGRGRNVSEGFLQCRGNIVGFADADGSTAAATVVPIVQAIRSGFEVAEAHRHYKIPLWELPFLSHRWLAHSTYAKLVSWGLGLKGHDTEAGFKFFRKASLLEMLPQIKSNGWFWDTQAIAVAHEKGYKVAEINSPFVLSRDMGSTVKFFRDSWSQFKNLAAYAWRKRQDKPYQGCCVKTCAAASAPGPEQPGIFERHFNLWFTGIVAAAGLVYALRSNQYGTGIINDDALYVLASSDLWNKSISYIFPHLRFDYPFPGLPVLLSPFTKLLSPHWHILEWVSVGATLLSIVALGRWTRRWMSPVETLAVTALYAFNPSVAKFSGILMPAPYYALAIIISFRLFEEVLERPAWFKILALGTVAGWGCLLRPEGFILLGSIIIVWIVKRPRKNIFSPFLLPLFLWALFVFIWVKTRGTPHSEFQGDLGALWAYWSENFFKGVKFIETMLRVFLVNTVAGVRFSSSSHSNWLSNIFRASIILTCFIGMWFGFRSLWRDKKINQAALMGMGTFCLSFFLVHLFWHIAIPRYAVPLLPFIFIFLVRGIFELHRAAKIKKVWAIAAFACVLISYASRNVNAVYESLWSPNPMNAPPWRSLQWLKKNTDSDAKIFSIIAPSIALYTNRRVTAYLEVFNIETFRYELLKSRSRYIVDRQMTSLVSNIKGTANANSTWNKIRFFIEQHPDWFELIFSEPEEKITIYRVHEDPTFMRDYEVYAAARKEFLAGQYESAFRRLGGSLEACPKTGGAFNLMGGLYFLRNDPPNAEAAFLSAIEVLPYSPIAMLNLATLYQRYNLPEAAAQYITLGMQVSTEMGEAEEFLDNLRLVKEHWNENGIRTLVDAV